MHGGGSSGVSAGGAGAKGSSAEGESSSLTPAAVGGSLCPGESCPGEQGVLGPSAAEEQSWLCTRSPKGILHGDKRLGPLAPSHRVSKARPRCSTPGTGADSPRRVPSPGLPAGCGDSPAALPAAVIGVGTFAPGPGPGFILSPDICAKQAEHVAVMAGAGGGPAWRERGSPHLRFQPDLESRGGR